MKWNVFVENFNSKKIEVYNIFDHGSFAKAVEELFNNCETKGEFETGLKSKLRYYFWSKCEWEIILTDWPTHISIEELNRMQKELNEYVTSYGHPPYSLGVNLKVSKKVDVFDQVMLNWDAFVNYVWREKLFNTPTIMETFSS